MTRVSRLIVFAILAVLNDADASQERNRPPTFEERVRSDRHYIWVQERAFRNGASMDLRFYGNDNLTGPPAMQLTEVGLYVDGMQVCSWPDARFDSSSRYMWLGFERRSVGHDAPPVGYAGCPNGVPIFTLYSFEMGTRLYIEILARYGAIVEAEYESRRLFFDLNTLPGDPVTPDSGEASSGDGVDASFGVQRRGFYGWAWIMAEDDRALRGAADRERLMEDEEFGEFRRSVQRCLEFGERPACLASYVDEPFFFPEAASELGGSGEVSAIQFARYAWRGFRGDVRRQLWAELRACSSGAGIQGVRRSAGFRQYAVVRTERGFVCRFRRNAGGWRLQEVEPVRYPMPPVDEATDDQAFQEFRDRMLTALARRRYELVEEVALPGVVWEEPWKLADVLVLGGSFTTTRGAKRGRREFCAPYFYSIYPERVPRGFRADADPWTISGEDVPVYAEPTRDADVVGHLTNELVDAPVDWRRRSTDGVWARVILSGGTDGWVESKQLHAPEGYVACFAQVDNQWMMTKYGHDTQF